VEALTGIELINPGLAAKRKSQPALCRLFGRAWSGAASQSHSERAVAARVHSRLWMGAGQTAAQATAEGRYLRSPSSVAQTRLGLLAVTQDKESGQTKFV
jgi:hypothetical protein